MLIDDFEGCCSAKIINDFGGGHKGEMEEWTKQAIIHYLKKQLTNLKKNYSVVFACVTTTQPNAIAALEEIGFYGYTSKGATDRTKDHNMFPFFLPLMEWDLKAFNERYDPRSDKYVNKDCYNPKRMTSPRIEERFW